MHSRLQRKHVNKERKLNMSIFQLKRKKEIAKISCQKCILETGDLQIIIVRRTSPL